MGFSSPVGSLVIFVPQKIGPILLILVKLKDVSFVFDKLGILQLNSFLHVNRPVLPYE